MIIDFEKLTKRERADLCKYIPLTIERNDRKQDLQELIERVRTAEAQAARQAMNEVDREVAEKLQREEQNETTVNQ